MQRTQATRAGAAVVDSQQGNFPRTVRLGRHERGFYTVDVLDESGERLDGLACLESYGYCALAWLRTKFTSGGFRLECGSGAEPLRDLITREFECSLPLALSG